MKTKATVLVVEDNPIYVKIIEKRLIGGGFKTVKASDGLIGYNLARKIQPDLILLDLMLPGLDGHKVCRLIKFHRHLRRIPIVIFTSRDTDIDRKTAYKSRADAFLSKTASSASMLDTVRRQLEKAEQDLIEISQFFTEEKGESALGVVPAEAVLAGIEP
jgi:DNA-binding response OmpR family regulator